MKFPLKMRKRRNSECYDIRDADGKLICLAVKKLMPLSGGMLLVDDAKKLIEHANFAYNTGRI